MTRAVIFDIGNVLLTWDMVSVFRPILGDGAAAFLARIEFDIWNRALDRGGRWADAIARAQAAHPDVADLIAMTDTHWQHAVPGEVPGSRAILDALHGQGVPLYAITNFSTEKWAEAMVRFPWLTPPFRDIVVSAHEGLLKPEPEIYQLCLSRNGLTAADCVFIDDSPANVAGARAVGLDAIHFTSAAQLAADLRHREFAL